MTPPMKYFDPAIHVMKKRYCNYRMIHGKRVNSPNCYTWFVLKNRGKNLFSKRFGYFSAYTAKEKNEDLRCPSGYTVGQAFNKLRKMWLGYRGASGTEKNLKRAEHYAREIQKTQDDLGIEITSFPQLGIFGERFVLYDKSSKTKEHLVDEDHSAFMATQKMYELKSEVAENEAIEIMVDSIPSAIPEPQPQPKEEIQVLADKPSKKKIELDRCEFCGGLLDYDADGNHKCKLDKNEKIEILQDDIPFSQVN